MIETKLHILLAKNRMSQKELSEKIGISKNTLSRYYNNNWTRIDKKDINKICNYFNCELCDFLEFIKD